MDNLFMMKCLIMTLAISQCVFFLLIYIKRPLTQNPACCKTAYPKEEIHYDDFLIDMVHCKIPNIDPFDTIARQTVGEPIKVDCSHKTPLTYRNMNKLHINWTAVRLSTMKSDFKNCQIQVIYRPAKTNKSKKFYKYLRKSKHFTDSITVKNEFIRVQCFGQNGTKVYTNFHIFFKIKPHVEQKCKKRFLREKIHKNIDESMNVLMLGIDSISRLNSMRFLQKTRKLVLREMGGIELLGYNKVADNTFPNIVPMVTGKFVEELPWNENMSNEPFDKYEFIWNKFSKKGFRTLFAEDVPSVSTFDYLKAGFHNAPADYFFRPFSLALWSKRKLWYGRNRICIHGSTETHDILDYTTGFLTGFKALTYFAFTYSTRLSHTELELVATADDIFYDFFKQLQRNNTLNNTFIVFFSDHGIRFGRHRNTKIGRLEERLPFCFLILPPWFKSKYPFLFKSLLINSGRLTTPFDIYETLKDVLHFRFTASFHKNRSTDRGITLFEEISNERTCNGAGISPHWCACNQVQNLNISEENVIKLANTLVSLLNEELKEYQNICETLKLDTIKSAGKLSLSDFQHNGDTYDKSKHEKFQPFIDYTVIVKTRPGGGLFEGSLRFHQLSKNYKILGDVSRINLYGQSSNCIMNSRLRKFCFCKIN